MGSIGYALKELISRNLQLPPETVKSVQEKLLRSMPRYELEQLPVVIDFLLSNCDKKEAATLVASIRESLDLDKKVQQSQRPTPGAVKKQGENKRKSEEVLIVEKIYMSMLTDKWMADAWISTITSLNESDEMKPLGESCALCVRAVRCQYL